jgi:hypothetical protein
VINALAMAASYDPDPRVPPDDTWWIYLALLFLGIVVIVNDPAKGFWRNFFVLWLNRRSAAGQGRRS